MRDGLPGRAADPLRGGQPEGAECAQAAGSLRSGESGVVGRHFRAHIPRARGRWRRGEEVDSGGRACGRHVGRQPEYGPGRQ